MKGRNIKRSPDVGMGVDEEGYLYYFSRRPSRIGWRPWMRGRKHLKTSHMQARMKRVDKMKAGEMTLGEAIEETQQAEATDG